MSGTIFPGSNMSREALLARVRQFEGELKTGYTVPNAAELYPNKHVSTTYEHRQFCKQMKRYEGATLGEMAQTAERIQAKADKAYHRWQYEREHSSPPRWAGQIVSAGMLGASIINWMIHGQTHLNVAMTLLSGGALILLNRLPKWISGHQFTRKWEAEGFQQTVVRWGHDLSGMPIPAPPPSMSASLTFGRPHPPLPPTPPTQTTPTAAARPMLGALSLSDLQALRAEIDARIQKASAPPPTVEIQEAQVVVGGIPVPRKTV